MPLSRVTLTISVDYPHYVRVPMEDRNKRVIVHVSGSALRERAAQDHNMTGNMALLYCAYREAIEFAASLKYDLGVGRNGSDIVILANDIF